MPLRKIFCPVCGRETQVDDEKEFCFCLQCGNKIIIHMMQDVLGNHEMEELESASFQKEEASNVEQKLEEVLFYYKLSQEKKEYENCNEEPVYYLKAQDLLLDLSEQYSNNYKIWWELCKPIDFVCPISGNSIYDQYSINEKYFSKALDCAELSIKRELVNEHDRYIKNKNIEREKAKSNKKTEDETVFVAQKEKEETVKQKKMVQNQELWEALAKKNYSLIHNSFFSFASGNNQDVVCVFQNISNMMYLIAFRIDRNKGNNIYRDQTISIKFDEAGHGIKFDNSNVRIKGFMPPDDILKITSDGKGGLLVNNMVLSFNQEYVAGIMKRAKKSLFSGKIFC